MAAGKPGTSSSRCGAPSVPVTWQPRSSGLLVSWPQIVMTSVNLIATKELYFKGNLQYLVLLFLLDSPDLESC